MTAHPDVLAALNDAHSAELTASKQFHLQEHEFKEGKRKIPKLAKWFDRRHKEASEREHDVRKTTIAHGGTLEPKFGDTSYTDDPGEALEKACKTLDGLSAAHEAVDAATRKAGKAEEDDANKAYYRGIRDKHRDFAQDLHKVYRKGEQKQQQLKDLGPALFIAKHS